MPGNNSYIFSNRIIRIVDTVGLKLVVGGTAETLLASSLSLSVKPADGTNFQVATFSVSNPSTVSVRHLISILFAVLIKEEPQNGSFSAEATYFVLFTEEPIQLVDSLVHILLTLVQMFGRRVP